LWKPFAGGRAGFGWFGVEKIFQNLFDLLAGWSLLGLCGRFDQQVDAENYPSIVKQTEASSIQ